mmetsp:Transcript_11948/g.21726  ORF Transcript_11948/g.21726 Transcript_11948/m.21726 type:complete len:170 (+) Transcript_11948:87-596(+)
MSDVDSYRFLDFTTRAIMKAWAKRDARAKQTIPWTPMARRLDESKVALVSTAGVARIDDIPFDQKGENQNPWWGDPTHRVIPRESTEKDVKLYHMHIDCETGEKDLDVFLPLRRLDDLVNDGIVGESAESHYSIMGYQLCTEVLENKTAPAMLSQLKSEKVDAVVLIPA